MANHVDHLISMLENAVADKLRDLYERQYDTSLENLEWEVIEGSFDKLRVGGEPQFTPEMRAAAARIRADAAVTRLTTQYRQLATDELAIRVMYFNAKRKRDAAEKELCTRVLHLIKQETEKDALTLKIQAVKELKTDVLQQLSDGVEVDITAALKHLEAI